MPFTFLSHQAPVLPLKIVAPRWFDGTALVVGSMAPDLVYLLGGTPAEVDAHTWSAQLTVCLPLTLALVVLTKRYVVSIVAPYVPDAGAFHLRDFARLAQWRMTPRSLGVAAGSAVIGSVSHIVIDAFTHGDGWGVRLLPWLRTNVVVLPNGIPNRYVNAFDVLQLGGSVLGAVATTAMLLYIGRQRLLTRWYPAEPSGRPATEEGRRRFHAGLVAAGATTVLLGAATLPVGDTKHLVVRSACVLGLGVVLAGAMARPTLRVAGRDR